MITSVSNQKVKDIINLSRKSSFRKERGLFVVEGIKMFMEIPDDMIDEVYASRGFLRNCDRMAQKKIDAHKNETVSDEVFAHMSDTKSPQGILATVRVRNYTLDEILENGNPALLILEKIQDPGNLGTMVRMGEGAGITGILMDGETVDIYNPKVVRSTMGSIFRVPFLCTDLKKSIQRLKDSGVTVYAAHLDGTADYDRENFQGPVAFMIGNESAGLSYPVALEADELIRIPMLGKVESLNAAVAASILAFEMARQRR